MSRKLMPSERYSVTFRQSDFIEKEKGKFIILKK